MTTKMTKKKRRSKSLHSCYALLRSTHACDRTHVPSTVIVTVFELRAQLYIQIETSCQRIVLFEQKIRTCCSMLTSNRVKARAQVPQKQGLLEAYEKVIVLNGL